MYLEIGGLHHVYIMPDKLFLLNNVCRKLCVPMRAITYTIYDLYSDTAEILD